MPSGALICANDFVGRANEEKMYLSRTKLLKLLYFLFGHYIAKTGEELFEEKFQAWQYGPVLTKVYNRTKRQSAIENYIPDTNGSIYRHNIDSEGTKKYFEIFDYVWDKYSGFSAATLTNLSHAAGSPWDITFNKKGEYCEIDNDLIKRYFLGESLQGDSANA